MKADKRLIDALRSTAEIIEDGKNYTWSNTMECNCGLLAQELLKHEEKLYIKTAIASTVGGYWSEAVYRDICPQTGLHEHYIFKKLMSYGLEIEDFRTIELINMEDHFDDYHVHTKSHRLIVADWMRDKAHELESQLV